MPRRSVIKEVSVTLRFHPEMELEASHCACAVAGGLLMSKDKVDEVSMAVVEACINAIEHSRSRDGKLYLTFKVLGREGQPEALEITVADRGVGFDRESVVEPRIESKLHAPKKRGWGLKIIEGLMDEVKVRSSTGGTKLVMKKSI